MSQNTITEEHINNLVDQSKIEYQKLGFKTTVLSCTLPNGFVIVESSSCVDEDNFDMEVGRDICIERIKNKLWELEGYLLQEKIFDTHMDNIKDDLPF